MASTSTANPPMAPPTAAPILTLDDDGGAFDSWATGVVGIEVDDGVETKLVLVLVLVLEGEGENPGGIYDGLAFNII